MNFEENNRYINVKDFSVSGESFTLLENKEYQLLKTHPTPSLETLGNYYESSDYISHTDSKRTLFEKLYHVVKTNSLRKKVTLISKYNSGTLLDIGAGTGDFLVVAKKKNWATFGIEPNLKARNLALEKGVTLKQSLLDFENHSFDVITMWHVLEHVPDIQNQIQELKRLLKPNGTIFIAVPNYNSFDAKYYKSFWAAYDVPRHLWHFSKVSISKLFQNYNLKLVKIKPMWFDSFYVSLLSEKYKTGKMNYISAFFIGLYSNLYGIAKKEFSSHIYIIKKM